MPVSVPASPREGHWTESQAGRNRARASPRVRRRLRARRRALRQARRPAGGAAQAHRLAALARVRDRYPGRPGVPAGPGPGSPGRGHRTAARHRRAGPQGSTTSTRWSRRTTRRTGSPMPARSTARWWSPTTRRKAAGAGAKLGRAAGNGAHLLGDPPPRRFRRRELPRESRSSPRWRWPRPRGRWARRPRGMKWPNDVECKGRKSRACSPSCAPSPTACATPSSASGSTSPCR